MKSKAFLAAIALAAGIAAGVPAVAKVSIQQVPSAELAPGSTFAWAPISGIALGAPTPAIVNQITAEQLAAATESALSSKGYRLVQDPSQADLIVAYRVITVPRVDAKLTAQDAPCGPLCHGRSVYNLDTSQKTHGTLVFDLVDRRTGRLVYRATSEKEISSKDVSQKRLESVLKQMTKALPSQ